MDIRLGDLDHPSVVRLLGEHLQAMTQYSPAESIHALDVSGLRQAQITFWTAWDGEELLGCAALKAMGEERGEIKSMRTAAKHLRQGVAAKLLAHVIDEARRRGYRQLFLETGAAEAFVPAHQLYAGFGFVLCGPFQGYVEDRYSVFMTRGLE